jgi:hypothetical protein
MPHPDGHQRGSAGIADTSGSQPSQLGRRWSLARRSGRPPRRPGKCTVGGWRPRSPAVSATRSCRRCRCGRQRSPRTRSHPNGTRTASRSGRCGRRRTTPVGVGDHPLFVVEQLPRAGVATDAAVHHHGLVPGQPHRPREGDTTTSPSQASPCWLMMKFSEACRTTRCLTSKVLTGSLPVRSGPGPTCFRCATSCRQMLAICGRSR